MTMPASRRSQLSVPIGVFLIALFNAGPAAAENLFDMNFQPVTDGNATSFFGITGTSAVVGSSIVTGQTPFVLEQVTDPTTSLTYYHMVLGSVASGFAQEVYIQDKGTFGGFQGGSSSASPGTGNVGGNGSDPLDVVNGIVTGNGGGNPTKVIMREVVSDSSMAAEFLKNSFTAKPKITQDLTSTDMTSHFVADMSNSDYATSSLPGSITYTVALTDGGYFDFATGVQNSNVTAGEYTYTSGSGPGGSNGTYTYAGGGSANTDTGVKWEDFWDPAAANPWVDSTNRP